jgi:hypothetical protein
VITARSAKPPLAVGIFGQWGDGKSLFLELVEEEVRERARAAGPADPIAHGHVRQVRFNAWHFAEADLWASLVAALFYQLTSPSTQEDKGHGVRQRSRLTSELIDARGLREELAAAQARRTALRTASRRVGGRWDVVPADVRNRMEELFGEQAHNRFQALSSPIPAVKVLVGSLIGLVRALPGWCQAGMVSAVVAATVLAIWGDDILGWLLPTGTAAVLLLLALGRELGSIQPALRKLRSGWRLVQQARAEQARRLETAEAVAEADVQRLTSELQNLTAAGELAGLVQERADGTGYRSRLGLMTQIRQDFERMAELLQRADADRGDVPEVDLAGDELPAIDRIVIYIDDLDRCPPDRVVDVLEAVHLLLAANLFVVVAAVDPRWLLRSIETHYQELFAAQPQTPGAQGQSSKPLDLSEDEQWAATPEQYLEKVFQIVLTLPPMETEGFRNMIDDLLGEQPVVASVDKANTHVPDLGTRAAQGPITEWSVSEVVVASPEVVSVASLPVVDRVDPLTLTSDEHRLVALLGPPMIVAPRAVKRFANSYGLLIAISARDRPAGDQSSHLTPVRDSDTETTYPYRAAMVLLATVIGFPSLSQALLPDLFRTTQSTPEVRWDAYLASLRPNLSGGRLVSRIDIGMTAGRASQWNALVDALDGVGEQAKLEGLDLPHRLTAWAEWVIPVGRLSFPTGIAVSRLGKQQHRSHLHGQPRRHGGGDPTTVR